MCISMHLPNKLECQQKGFYLKHYLHFWPLQGNQRPGDLLIRVLCWPLFSERVAGELSAGNAKICNRANKDNSKRKRLQGWVEAGVNLEGPL